MITLTLETKIEDGVSCWEVFKDGKHVAAVELYYDDGDTLCECMLLLVNYLMKILIALCLQKIMLNITLMSRWRNNDFSN